VPLVTIPSNESGSPAVFAPFWSRLPSLPPPHLRRFEHLAAKMDDCEIARAKLITAAVGEWTIVSHMTMSWFGMPGIPVQLPDFMARRSWR